MSNPTEPYLITLVGARLWHELLDEALEQSPTGPGGERAQLDARVCRIAEAVIATLHSRHVGITPAAAVGLARLLVGEQAQSRAGAIWDAVTARLRRELQRTLAAKPKSLARQPGVAAGFVLREAPTYTVLRLALPLFAAACAQVGRSLLACADEPLAGVDRAAYTSYQHDLHEVVESISQSDYQGGPDPYALFWIEIALTYASNAMKPTINREAPALPGSDPLALGWMLRLKPDPAPLLHEHNRPRVVTTPLKRQRSRRLNEGGVTGYKLTRRIEDFSGIVQTELINPELIFLDRVLNAGYLTIERPPRHQKRRHVLVVGMLPPETQHLPLAGLAKACWFDCMWRFSVFLRSQELYRSEIRWIEGDRPDRARSASYMLQDLPILAHDETFNDGDRWMFLKALRWVPSFLNWRDRPVRLPLAAPSGVRDLGPDYARWCRAAWAVQRDNARHDMQSGGTPRPWGEAIEEFAHVHLMVFLPATAQAADDSAEAHQAWRRLISHFAAGLGVDVHTSVTWIPHEPLTDQPWRLISAGRSVTIDPTADPAQLASRLEQSWIDRLIEDTCRE